MLLNLYLRVEIYITSYITYRFLKYLTNLWIFSANLHKLLLFSTLIAQINTEMSVLTVILFTLSFSTLLLATL